MPRSKSTTKRIAVLSYGGSASNYRYDENPAYADQGKTATYAAAEPAEERTTNATERLQRSSIDQLRTQKFCSNRCPVVWALHIVPKQIRRSTPSSVISYLEFAHCFARTIAQRPH
jgi:hypothetical protein